MIKRNISIDIIKGIGIVLMVLGHSQFPLTHFIYLFHMPIFFIASGYLFDFASQSDAHSLVCFIKRKFKGLWLPFFVWNTIFIVLNNLFVLLHIYHTDTYNFVQYPDTIYINSHFFSLKETIIEVVKSMFLIGGTALTGALWFLRELLMVLILFALINFLLRDKQCKTKLIIHGIFAIVFLIFGWIIQQMKIPSTTSIGTMCSVYFLIYIGALFKHVSFEEKLSRHRLLSTIVVFALLICFNFFGSIDLADNIYSNPLFLVIVSILGWIFLWNISYGIKRNKIFTDVLCYLGKNTMPIIALNFICFKPITYFLIEIEQLPIQYLAAYPVLKSNNFLWIIYTMTSILLALLLNTVYKKFCFRKDR